MKLGIIIIGRNEGERLRACLASLIGRLNRQVYVDSGSKDCSTVIARAMGVEVVELDSSQPHSAARGRNAGVAALRAAGLPQYLQFVDGDCTVEPGWIEAAMAALDAEPDLALVTGWRTERSPDANAYHAMAEIEWHRPAGEIASCGGDMMVRASAFDAVGGFDAALVVSEDEDFVQRLRKAGYRARRLPVVMTRHDIDMRGIGAWWRRAQRAGHGFAEVGRRHPPHFLPERRRAVVYGLILPLILIGGVAGGILWPALRPAFWGLSMLALGAYAFSYMRVLRALRRGEGRDLSLPMTRRVASLFTLAKLPQLVGMAQYHLRRLRRLRPELIEYK